MHDHLAVRYREISAYWRLKPENWPVKIVSLVAESPLQREAALGGYFTCLKFVSGRRPSELREILGLKATDLTAGAILYQAIRLPTAEEFGLRGYTHWHPGNEGVGAGYAIGHGAAQWQIHEGKSIPWRLAAIVTADQPLP